MAMSVTAPMNYGKIESWGRNMQGVYKHTYNGHTLVAEYSYTSLIYGVEDFKLLNSELFNAYNESIPVSAFYTEEQIKNYILHHLEAELKKKWEDNHEF